MNNFKEKADKILEVANLLRDDYKRSDYGKVILPMTVLGRLDCVLAPNKQRALWRLQQRHRKSQKIVQRSKEISYENVKI